MKLIDKDKVVSMLQDKIADIELDMKCGFLKKRKGANNILIIEYIIYLIDTLEVKDVYFEKELENYYNDNFSQCNDGTLLSEKTGTELIYHDYECIAKHFFELGLKAQKGE